MFPTTVGVLFDILGLRWACWLLWDLDLLTSDRWTKDRGSNVPMTKKFKFIAGI